LLLELFLSSWSTPKAIDGFNVLAKEAPVILNDATVDNINYMYKHLLHVVLILPFLL
jgi:hypothetical protein